MCQTHRLLPILLSFSFRLIHSHYLNFFDEFNSYSPTFFNFGWWHRLLVLLVEIVFFERNAPGRAYKRWSGSSVGPDQLLHPLIHLAWKYKRHRGNGKPLKIHSKALEIQQKSPKRRWHFSTRNHHTWILSKIAFFLQLTVNPLLWSLK